MPPTVNHNFQARPTMATGYRLTMRACRPDVPAFIPIWERSSCGSGKPGNGVSGRPATSPTGSELRIYPGTPCTDLRRAQSRIRTRRYCAPSRNCTNSITNPSSRNSFSIGLEWTCPVKGRPEHRPSTKEGSMSQRQLRLVFSNSKTSSSNGKLSSVTCRMLRSSLSGSSRLQQKVARLESRSPGAAALVERLVDRMLDRLTQ